MERPERLVVAITGASGAIYAYRLLKLLWEHWSGRAEVCVVASRYGRQVWEHELGLPFPPGGLPFRCFEEDDFNAPCASGSAGYRKMVVVPCSVGTLARIASGVTDNLIVRSADVVLKEGGKLVLVVREAPYNAIHLENMLRVVRAGGIIFPASPPFYHKPESIEELVDAVVWRVLELVGFPVEGVYRWGS